MSTTARRHAPATVRNREHILAVLARYVSPGQRVIEIASGSGEHSVFFAPRLDVIWQPSDVDEAARASIDAHVRDAADARILPAIAIDATAPFPKLDKGPDLAVCINMIHISPWRACEGLLDGVAAAKIPLLYLYGPYKRNGQHTAPSNASFDEGLRMQNPEWGVRDLEEVTDAAKKRGLDRVEIVEMPANNLSVIFRATTLPR